MWNNFIQPLVRASIISIVLGASAWAAADIYPPKYQWSWTGFLGSYDKESAQRGLQVYKEVCSGCHGLRLIRFRNLADLGYSANAIKQFAAEFDIVTGTDGSGDAIIEAGKPSHAFPTPDLGDGNNPPDLSIMVDARANGHGNILDNFISAITAQDNASGADYLYSLLLGYDDPPADMDVIDGLHYNKWFPGHQISMAAPLYDDAVTYEDGTEATTEQMAHDVVTFLAWTSEPQLEQRRSMGLIAIVFLLFFVFVLYLSKRRIWRNVKK